MGRFTRAKGACPLSLSSGPSDTASPSPHCTMSGALQFSSQAPRAPPLLLRPRTHPTGDDRTPTPASGLLAGPFASVQLASLASPLATPLATASQQQGPGIPWLRNVLLGLPLPFVRQVPALALASVSVPALTFNTASTSQQQLLQGEGAQQQETEQQKGRKRKDSKQPKVKLAPSVRPPPTLLDNADMALWEAFAVSAESADAARGRVPVPYTESRTHCTRVRVLNLASPAQCHPIVGIETL